MFHGKEGVKNTFKLFTMHHPLEYSYNKVRKTFEIYFKVNFEYLSVPHRPPQFNRRTIPCEIPQFNTKSSSVQHQKTPQLNIPLSSTKPTVQHQKPVSSAQKRLNSAHSSVQHLNPLFQHSPHFNTKNQKHVCISLRIILIQTLIGR